MRGTKLATVDQIDQLAKLVNLVELVSAICRFPCVYSIMVTSAQIS